MMMPSEILMKVRVDALNVFSGVAVGFLAASLIFGLRSCSHPTRIAAPQVASVAITTPSPKAEAVTSAGASTTGVVTIRRTEHWKRPLDTSTASNVSTASPDVDEGPTTTEEITISLAAQATSSALASASVPIVSTVPQPSSIPPAIGIIAGTMDGIGALDYRVARAELGGWTAGVDVEGNLQQVGVGMSVGKTLFASAGVEINRALDVRPWVGLGVRLTF